MALKYKCKWCGTGTASAGQPCFNCREKYKILKESGLFGGKAKRKIQQHKTRWELVAAEELYRYSHELGSETQKLVDFVNKSDTIHYGREKSKERMGV